MSITPLWDETNAGSSGSGFFTIITTTNITLQDIEKNKRLNIKMDKIPWRKSHAGLKKASLEGFQNSLGID